MSPHVLDNKVRAPEMPSARPTMPTIWNSVLTFASIRVSSSSSSPISGPSTRTDTKKQIRQSMPWRCHIQ